MWRGLRYFWLFYSVFGGQTAVGILVGLNLYPYIRYAPYCNDCHDVLTGDISCAGYFFQRLSKIKKTADDRSQHKVLAAPQKFTHSQTAFEP
jgi:hypothetical protein